MVVFNNWREEYKYALDMAYAHALKTIETAPEKIDLSMSFNVPVHVSISINEKKLNIAQQI
jgi:hypothetical protein